MESSHSRLGKDAGRNVIIAHSLLDHGWDCIEHDCSTNRPDIGVSQRLQLVLRSSPIICAAHATVTILQLGYYRQHTSDRFEALAIWAAIRFDDCDDPIGALQNARKGLKVLIIAFTLGACWSVIKIFSVSGIVITRIICGAYFAAFALDHIIILLTRRNALGYWPPALLETLDNLKRRNVFDYLAAFFVVLSFSLAERVLLHGLVSTMAKYISLESQILSAVVIMLVIMGFLVQSYTNFAILRFIVDLRFPPSSGIYATSRQAAGSVLSGELEVFAHAGLNMLATESFYTIPAARLVPRLLAHSLSFLIACLPYLADGLGPNLNPELQRERFRKFFGIMFFVVHLLGALFWYLGVHDASSTHKPQWTSYFG